MATEVADGHVHERTRKNLKTYASMQACWLLDAYMHTYAPAYAGVTLAYAAFFQA